MSVDRLTSVAREILIDSYTQTLFIRGWAGGWGLQGIGASASQFGWPTLYAAIDFLDSKPAPYTFRSFPDDTFKNGDREECALIIGILGRAVFFGYQGFEAFWGGVIGEETAREILDEARRLADDYGAGR